MEKYEVCKIIDFLRKYLRQFNIRLFFEKVTKKILLKKFFELPI